MHWRTVPATLYRRPRRPLKLRLMRAPATPPVGPVPEHLGPPVLVEGLLESYVEGGGTLFLSVPHLTRNEERGQGEAYLLCTWAYPGNWRDTVLRVAGTRQASRHERRRREWRRNPSSPPSA